jgi:3-oxoacid CoA-transferase subunit B
MARRVAGEFKADQVVALGPGLPARVADVLPAGAPVQLLSDGGALGHGPASIDGESGKGALLGANGESIGLNSGGSVFGMVDWAAMLRGGHVDVAVVQPTRVNAQGDFIGWTTAATPGLFAPGSAVDLAAGGSRLIAMLPHTGADGSPNIVGGSSPLADGRGCVDLIITDLAVLRIEGSGLVLAEVAPGWRADDVASLTGAPISMASDLKEFDSNLDALNGRRISKVCPDGPSAIGDMPDGAVVMIDGFGGPGGMAHYLL